MFLKIVINNQRCATKPLKFVVIFKIQCHVSIFSHYTLSFSCISAIYVEAGMANSLFFFFTKIKILLIVLNFIFLITFIKIIIFKI